MIRRYARYRGMACGLELTVLLASFSSMPFSVSSPRKRGPITAAVGCLWKVPTPTGQNREAAAYGSLLSQGRRKDGVHDFTQVDIPHRALDGQREHPRDVASHDPDVRTRFCRSHRGGR